MTRRWRAALVVSALIAVGSGVAFWLMHRDPAQPHVIAPSRGVVVVASVGDILLADAAAATLRQRGHAYPFQRVQSLCAGADLLMGNLEGPITEHATAFAPEKDYIYRQPLAVAGALRKAGFGALALGNNHALDYGPVGLDHTMQALDAAGILHFGAGTDESAARRGVVITRKGVRIGLLSYLEPYPAYEQRAWYAATGQPGVARLDIEAIRSDIARLRPEADIIIVHAHFGENYRGVTEYQRRIARAIIDAGGDVVNGHHPHVAQGVDIYRGKPILYSLGNFTFGTPGRFSSDMRGYGWVARYRIDAATRRLTAIDLDLIATDNDEVGFQPRPVGTREARLAWAGIEIGFNATVTWQGSTATLSVGR